MVVVLGAAVVEAAAGVAVVAAEGEAEDEDEDEAEGVTRWMMSRSSWRPTLSQLALALLLLLVALLVAA
eukprot:COSAG06_NODE_1704_length_8655_cov_104.626812_2_plen_69_part_00